MCEQDVVDYKELMHKVCLLAGSKTDFDNFLEESFALIGQTLNISRVYYFNYDHCRRVFNNTIEWVGSGIASEKANLQNIPFHDVHWFYRSMIDKNILKFQDIEAIDDEAVRSILKRQNIKSILVVPIYVENQFEGFIGFDECAVYKEWSSMDEMLLYSIAVMGAQGIKENRLKATVQKRYEELLNLADNIGGLCYAVDINSYEIIYANRNIKNMFDEELEGKICYQALQGKSAPCDFCTNTHILTNDGTYTWTYFNEKLNKEFYLIDKLIEMPEGKQVRFEVAIDITEQKRMERQLMLEKEFMRVTLISMGDGVVTTDVHGRITMINEAGEQILSCQQVASIGLPIGDVFKSYVHESRMPCMNPIDELFKTGDEKGSETHLAIVDHNGVYKNIRSTAQLMVDNDGNLIGAVLVFTDITKEIQKDEQIKYLSQIDGTTGLYTRSYCESLIDGLDISSSVPIAVIMGDVNGLKIVNDSYGHSYGDNLLRKIGQLLKNACRKGDIAARWGGDEFLIIMPGGTREEAHQICSNIKRACENSGEEDIFIDSISLGYAVLQNPDETMKEVFKEAEDHMYRKKLLESKSLRSSVINSIKQTLHEKSYETETHARRLCVLSQLIGVKMRLSPKELGDLELSAMLHDIGKITVNNEILEKKGPLSDEEWSIMKGHSESGFRILKAIPELSHVAEYILSHHERWDGSGYPQGKAGKDIPLCSRIIGVVDAFDAMTHDRVYRSAMTQNEAIQEIMINAGSQFDPSVVNVFIKVIDAFNDSLT